MAEDDIRPLTDEEAGVREPPAIEGDMWVLSGWKAPHLQEVPVEALPHTRPFSEASPVFDMRAPIVDAVMRTLQAATTVEVCSVTGTTCLRLVRDRLPAGEYEVIVTPDTSRLTAYTRSPYLVALRVGDKWCDPVTSPEAVDFTRLVLAQPGMAGDLREVLLKFTSNTEAVDEFLAATVLRQGPAEVKRKVWAELFFAANSLLIDAASTDHTDHLRSASAIMRYLLDVAAWVHTPAALRPQAPLPLRAPGVEEVTQAVLSRIQNGN